MAKPYSDDLRERVVRAVNGGLSRHKVAAQFEVSVSFVVKILQRFQATGSYKPDHFGGHNPPKLAAHEATVRELVEQAPSATLLELRRRLSERGIEVSKSSIDRYLKRLRISFKKNTSRGRATTPRHSRGASRMAGNAADA
jgi:transposase